MPRVIVTTDQTKSGDALLLLDERVNPVHLSADHAAMQFIERLGWAISDAEEAERVEVRRPTGRITGARRLASHRRFTKAHWRPRAAAPKGARRASLGRRPSR